MTWISVTDKLPEAGIDVLVWIPKDGWQEIGWYEVINNKWFNGDGEEIIPTHWMPLPEPPEEMK